MKLILYFYLFFYLTFKCTIKLNCKKYANFTLLFDVFRKHHKRLRVKILIKYNIVSILNTRTYLANYLMVFFLEWISFDIFSS